LTLSHPPGPGSRVPPAQAGGPPEVIAAGPSPAPRPARVTNGAARDVKAVRVTRPAAPVSPVSPPNAGFVAEPGVPEADGPQERSATRAGARPRVTDGQGREVAVPLPWADPGMSKPFYEDAELHSLYTRASAYLRAGVAIRFQGPAGTGKTAMALRVARGLGRPVAFLTGHSRMSPEDLVGREIGHRTSRVEDKYIASVRRTETRTRADWQDGALAAAMRAGQTLVYDEFTRAPTEANAPLLSVLEEGVLVIPHPDNGREILRAHPGFRLILSSNPAEYRGTQDAPDALLDRLVTFDLAGTSAETEAGIVASATGIAPTDATRIVALLRGLRDRAAGPAAQGQGAKSDIVPVSMRTAILIARLAKAEGVPTDGSDARFVQICADVLRGRLTCADTESAVAALLSESSDRRNNA